MSEIISGDAGRVSFLLKGNYDSTITYDFLDVVYYNGASYSAKNETTGNPPTRNEYWQILAGYELTKEDIENILEYVPTEIFAKKSLYNDTNVSMGRKAESLVGNKSFAFGDNIEASGYCSHAEGKNTIASNNQSHSEGFETIATGAQAHAEGSGTSAFNRYSHASGVGTVSTGLGGYSEGLQTISGNGYILHIKSVDTDEKRIVFTETYDNFAEAFSKIVPGTLMHVINIYYINTSERFTVKSIDPATNSVVVNENISTSDFTPWLAVLSVTNTSSSTAHAEGKRTIANGGNSHSEGEETIASGTRSHAENYYTVASGYNSHAGGYLSEASGMNSFAHGHGAAATSLNQTAIGRFNRIDARGDSFLNPFLVGIGSSESNRVTGFRVNSNGAVYGKSEYNSSGADYAEFIYPWYDGNENDEDRVGYFVTVKDGYLHKADAGDYIAGITSGNPSIVGNSDEEYYWRWKRDDFNRIIYEEVEEYEEAVDEDGSLVIKDGTTVMVPTGKMISRMKQSEKYDDSLQQSYVERKYRKEWDYVGMLGVLPVRDDGTCITGKFCECSSGGIATLAENRGFDTYMVVERISENVVSVILK